jgi:quercetin dioxygenase-like cupin family protein
MRRTTIAAVAAAFCLSTIAFAQDAPATNPTHYKTVAENPTIRVLKVTYGAGEKSTMHSHPDTVVVSLAASKVRFTGPDGTTQDAELPNEAAMYIPATTHASTNVGAARSEAIVIELKGAPGSAALPATRTGLTMKTLAEGPRAVAQRITAAADFQEQAGTKHDYDQVVIALGSLQMSLSLDGKPARTTWARGDAVIIPRGTAHESKNLGGKPADFIIVAIK